MKVTQTTFHPALGHMVHGMKIHMDNGDDVELVHGYHGWQLVNEHGNVGKPTTDKWKVLANVIEYPYIV